MFKPNTHFPLVNYDEGFQGVNGGRSQTNSIDESEDHCHFLNKNSGGCCGSSRKLILTTMKNKNRRMKGLEKKFYEFKTLCDVEACVICLDSKMNGEIQSTTTWPENRSEVEEILYRYKKISPVERRKRELDLSNFFVVDNADQAHTKKQKIELQNYDNYPTWDKKLDEFSDDSLRNFKNQLESILAVMKERENSILNKNIEKKETTHGFDDDQTVVTMNDHHQIHPQHPWMILSGPSTSTDHCYTYGGRMMGSVLCEYPSLVGFMAVCNCGCGCPQQQQPWLDIPPLMSMASNLVSGSASNDQSKLQKKKG